MTLTEKKKVYGGNRRLVGGFTDAQEDCRDGSGDESTRSQPPCIADGGEVKTDIERVDTNVGPASLPGSSTVVVRECVEGDVW